jgi:hypothetical protein
MNIFHFQQSSVLYESMFTLIVRDHSTNRLVKVISMEVETSPEEILDGWGEHFVLFAGQNGYAKVLRCMGDTFLEFVSNINNLHMHLSLCFDTLSAPSFRCTNVSQRTCLALSHAPFPTRCTSPIPAVSNFDSRVRPAASKTSPERRRPTSRWRCTTRPAGQVSGRSSAASYAQ